MMNLLTLERIDLADIDRHFGRFIARFGGETELVEMTAALLSRYVRDGHICFDLGEPVGDSAEQLDLPPPAKWRRRLLDSPAFGPPEALTPIVVVGDRIFLRRYWDYQQTVAD